MDTLRVEAYLAHLGLPHVKEASIDALTELQKRHLYRIPWENLDIFFKRTHAMKLDVSVIVDKFVSEHRGGICFELNGAYHQLLVALGFKTTLMPARIFAFNDKRYQNPRDTHVVILVEIQGATYLTDVAWNGFRTPLPLSGEVFEDVMGIHRMSLDESGGYCLQTYISDRWHTQYRLLDQSVTLDEVAHHLDYTHASPEREAAHQLMCIQHTPTGSISLVDHKVIVHQASIRQECLVSEKGGLRQVLTEIFHIRTSAVDALCGDRTCHP